MFERDHIMRQINVLSQAIARALALRAENRETEAMRELDRALEDLAGRVEPRPSDAMDPYSLSVTPDGRLQPYAYDVAQILQLKGDSYTESGLVDRAREAYTDARRIYETILREPEAAVPWDIQDRIDGLMERLQDLGSQGDR